jgi:hypothetical protein
MWDIHTLWFEISIISSILLLWHIFFGHFEERSSKLRKLGKAIMTYAIVISLSLLFGRTIAFITLGLWIIPVLYIHAIRLPKKWINGWTGEPKSKYYELRGRTKDIFSKK